MSGGTVFQVSEHKVLKTVLNKKRMMRQELEWWYPVVKKENEVYGTVEPQDVG